MGDTDVISAGPIQSCGGFSVDSRDVGFEIYK